MTGQNKLTLIEKTKKLENELALKNRELEIEAALERVRAKTMAMLASEEIGKIIYQVFSELKNLGVVHHLASISTDFELNKDWFNLWYASDEKEYAHFFRYNQFDHPINEKWKTALLNGDTLIVDHYSKTEKDAWYDGLFRFSDLSFVSEERKKLLYQTPGLNRIVSLAKNSALSLFKYNNDEFTEEDKNIVARFGNLFEQSYTRFLDLKTAEEQAFEAKIEVALEKVRSRSMGMYKSDELQEVVTLVFEQFYQLGIKIDSSIINIFKDNSRDFNMWISDGKGSYVQKIHMPYFKHPIFDNVFDAKAKGTYFVTKIFNKEETQSFMSKMVQIPDFKDVPEDRKKFLLSVPGFSRSVALGKYTAISISNYDITRPFSDVENDILKRVAKVFEQTYLRFLDLQKAEQQAREAQIETALERVRSRTMGMQKSEELAEVIAQINAEITNLGSQSDNTGLITDIKLDEKLGSFCMWFSIPGKTYSNKFKLPVMQHPIVDRMIEAWKKKKEFYTESLSKEEKNEYFKIAFKETDLKLLPDERKEILLKAPGWSQSIVLQKNSGLIIQRFRDEPFSDAENAVAIRFGRVFEQTYTRFLDLQKAEQQLRQAVKQASLDRVRGEIASMRTKDDLDRITPLIWKELIALGVPFIRCGVFIMDEEKNEIHTYLSTPDGHAIAAFHTPLDDSGPLNDAIDHWRIQKKYMAHWVEKDFSLQADVLVQHGAITSREQYLNSIPKTGFYLHFSPFTQGMLYVGSMVSLQPDDFQLVQSLADAFSVAYARYEDFKQLEEAKIQTEKTLDELKDTQKQLIQSEKMASLGELTAGIAHEIQNPLNFVNNFSEVNTELIEELKEEIRNGNLKEIEALANDISGNEQKINHHGKRAEAIVKGMLQHSRTSTGQKELTNINALADEYLRLSYHGLRAKDKSFNADFKTEFDESLPKINVIPQDIGRVLLNLINNAFYVVDKRAKETTPQPPEGGAKNTQTEYRPTVTISTTSSKSPSGDLGVKINVKDNGSGIPPHIVDKIFQPFFTTKPTGSGTGLGLSLSYDIVKAHGGELTVETKEGEGSVFIIHFPNH